MLLFLPLAQQPRHRLGGDALPDLCYGPVHFDQAPFDELDGLQETCGHKMWRVNVVEPSWCSSSVLFTSRLEQMFRSTMRFCTCTSSSAAPASLEILRQRSWPHTEAGLREQQSQSNRAAFPDIPGWIRTYFVHKREC